MIGRGEGLTEAVQRTLSSLDCAEIIPVERYSEKGRYISITFQLQVESGAQLDAIYSALEQLPGVVYLF